MNYPHYQKSLERRLRRTLGCIASAQRYLLTSELCDSLWSQQDGVFWRQLRARYDMLKWVKCLWRARGAGGHRYWEVQGTCRTRTPRVLWLEFFTAAPCLLWRFVSRNSWSSFLWNFSRCFIELAACYDATLPPPVEALASRVLRVAILLFVFWKAKYLHTEDILSRPTAELLFYYLQSRVIVRFVHSQAQTTEWSMERWRGLAPSVRYLMNKWCQYWTPLRYGCLQCISRQHTAEWI